MVVTHMVESMSGTLPIAEFRKQIGELVQKNLFCIITGETGSGKSTQISQYILDDVLQIEKFAPFEEISKEDIQAQLKCELDPSTEFKPYIPDMARIVVTQPRRVAAT